jgi:predicted lysophospholipase L1 biosynthesis ABC-type transport system permease subunit
LFIGVLGIANTMAMSVHERTREIGMLRAMGWIRSRIVRMILLEASILSLAGGVLGLVAGYAGLSVLAIIRRTDPGVAQASVSPLLCAEALIIAIAIGLQRNPTRFQYDTWPQIPYNTAKQHPARRRRCIAAHTMPCRAGCRLAVAAGGQV